ncbi:MAG: hypothetical protein D8M59_09835 [Planctomycetes bacterium]|nr:hypothetical protein [Planctomycetota bacterium]NOG53442.1 hypothetical protein [Planctomycetota bacterium]
MSMHVWLNGQIVERDDARVSAFDAGFQHGIGLFETMQSVNGQVYRLPAHLNRLAASANDLRLTAELNTDLLASAVQMMVEESDISRARVRLTITGGDLNLLQTAGSSPVTPTILIVVQPATPYPDELFEKGASAVIADGRANPLDRTAGHKTLNYWARLQALQQAAAARASEALWFGITNHLASGSVSNVFLVKDGRLQTPFARGEELDGSLPSPVLPGITRAAVMELAQEMGIESDVRMLDINDVEQADEVFLTNSSWGVLPIVNLEGRTEIGDGSVGEVTSALRSTLLRDVAGEDATSRQE